MESRYVLIFAAMAVAIFMVDVDMTAINLAVASIARELSISMRHAQWIVDGYSMAAASMMVFAGRLGDKLGLQRVLLAGLVAFAFASLAVALAFNESSIIIARIFQGASIAFIFPISIALVPHTFPEDKHGMVSGLLVSIAGLSQAVGPSLGALIINLASWRWIYFINLPLSALAGVIIKRYLRPTAVRETHLDSLPTVLFVLSIFAIMYACNSLSQAEAASWLLPISFGVGLLCAVWFIYLELKSATPLLDITLFQFRQFRAINAVRFLMNFCYFSLLFVLSLFLQNVLSFTVLETGMLLMLMTLLFGVVSMPVGVVIDKLGFARLITAGMLLLTIDFIIFALFAATWQMIWLYLALALGGIAVAIVIPSSGVAVMHSVPGERIGAAMGIFFTNGFLGVSIGVALCGYGISTLSHWHFLKNLPAEKLPSLHAQSLSVQKALSGIEPVNAISPALRSLVMAAFSNGFQWTMIVFAGLSFLASLLSIALHQKRNF